MTAMSNETRLREDICRFGRSLFERGLTPGSSGNISVRLDGGGWLVTPTNASLGFLDPAKLSRLDEQGRLVSGDAPTKEVPLHTALYATRGSARAIVHLHSTHSVALSMLPRGRSACRAAADDGLLFDEMRRHRARALLPPRRSRGG
ncbi:ribulose-5-phosphate 4-epimerase/fuculose-1-phosphate aldolase [Bradyrhizobium sp. LM6.10]